MKPGDLVRRGLAYYWRTNLAVILGVAAAVAVLSGALLVGDSVRGSLADLVSERIGRTDLAIVSTNFFREKLAEELVRQPDFPSAFESACPLIAAEGVVTVQEPGGARAGRVRVYGVDDRFWRFHGLTAASLDARQAVIGAPLAEELGVGEGATLLIRVEHPSEVPLESLHARKDDRVRTLRATIKSIAQRNDLGEFSLDTSQSVVRAVFLPLSLVQREMQMEGRVNTILIASRAGASPARAETGARLLRDVIQLEDLGLRAQAFGERQEFALDADSGILDNSRTGVAVEAARAMKLEPETVFTYLANSIRIGEREVPYSLVTARGSVVGQQAPEGPPPIELNTWAAEQLRARVGDPVHMEFYVWEEPGRLATQSADFQVSRIVPLDPGDRALAPVYPGITDSPTLEDWSPPFPIDLRRVRKVDEDYWKQYRTTPKAFIPLEVGQRLWRSRYGEATSVRMRLDSAGAVSGARDRFAADLSKRIDPLAMGFAARDVRAEGALASRGATDFGLYFTYFSFFIVVAALAVTALFFKLNVEQRAREVGLLRATGFGSGPIRRLFLGEGAALAVAGAFVGLAAGVGYAALLVTGLKTWWVGAVGTTALTLHVSPISLAVGGLSGVAAALICVWITLRGLARVSERRLLAGFIDRSDESGTTKRSARLAVVSVVLAAAGAALIAVGATGLMNKPGAFFGAGALLVVACLSSMALAFRRPRRNPIVGGGHDRRPVYRLGFRNAAFRPARSVAAMAAIAAAAFILISVDAFRRSGAAASSHDSGSGGYSLAVDLLVPIAHDPASDEGRKELNLEDLALGAVEPFRVRPGDDASCLNLYAPANPRILAPKERFVRSGRFAFRNSLAETPEERANPWLLLERNETDGAIPVIADANSISYVLKRNLGEDIVINSGGTPVRLRLVAALDDSIFQSELIMSERHFLKLFPEQAGYGFLLAEAGTAPAIEEALADFGADATSTEDRLAEFHRVENTYISTFQTLGGLGLLLGTVGLGAVLLRSAAERRRELALLRAIGYKRGDFFAMTLAENAVLLGAGLLIGAICALLAIAPALMERGGQLPSPVLLGLLAATVLAGVLTSLAATTAVLRSPLLASLRSE